MLASGEAQAGIPNRANTPAAIKRIVVPLDGTPYAERSIAHAIALARTFGAEIVLVRADPGEGGHDPSGLPRRRARERLHAASLYLARKEQELRRAGVRVSSRVPGGTAGSAVVAAARECAADLILVATHAGSMLSHPSQLSVADEILREAAIPVLLLGASTRQPVEPGRDEVLRLLLPLADDEGGSEELALLRQVEILAHAYPCRLLILRACGDPYASVGRANRTHLGIGPSAASLERLREQMLAPGCAAWTALVYSNVLEETVRQSQVNGDLILLGLPACLASRQRAANAAFRLLRETTLPVLCVPAVESERSAATAHAAAALPCERDAGCPQAAGWLGM